MWPGAFCGAPGLLRSFAGWLVAWLRRATSPLPCDVGIPLSPDPWQVQSHLAIDFGGRQCVRATRGGCARTGHRPAVLPCERWRSGGKCPQMPGFIRLRRVAARRVVADACKPMMGLAIRAGVQVRNAMQGRAKRSCRRPDATVRMTGQGWPLWERSVLRSPGGRSSAACCLSQSARRIDRNPASRHGIAHAAEIADVKVSMTSEPCHRAWPLRQFGRERPLGTTRRAQLGSALA